jgi:two-component system sensor histidine kinase UhpB
MSVMGDDRDTRMRALRRLPLYWRVCMMNSALFIIAALLLAFAPITISDPITSNQAIGLVIGLVIILVANALLLRVSLRPLLKLTALMHRVDLLSPGERLSADAAWELGDVIDTFNLTLTRLEQERRESSIIAFTAQEEERRRVARDLHDEIGQNLTGLLLFLRRAAETEGEERQRALAEAQATARLMHDELHRLDAMLRPSVLDDLGLAAALTELTQTHRARTAAEVDASIDESVRLDERSELVAYRIAQEALTNVARHADASRVAVVLRRTGASTVELTVRDDGVGLNGAAARGGVRGMRERALAVGGNLDISGAPGQGTTVQLRLNGVSEETRA